MTIITSILFMTELKGQKVLLDKIEQYLEGDDKVKEENHVDHSEDDCLLQCHQKKEGTTHKYPVFAQQIPKPTS